MTKAASPEPRNHVAFADCERVRPGLVAQPVNTVSSLAYCAAGVAILRRGPRHTLLGLAAIAAGLGSVAYHGPGGMPARALHDLSAAALGVAVTLAVAAPDTPSRTRSTTVALLAAGTVVHAASRTSRVLCRPDSVLQGHALWHLLGAAAAFTAGTR